MIPYVAIFNNKMSAGAMVCVAWGFDIWIILEHELKIVFMLAFITTSISPIIKII
jgi:hypothetical protein